MTDLKNLSSLSRRAKVAIHKAAQESPGTNRVNLKEECFPSSSLLSKLATFWSSWGRALPKHAVAGRLGHIGLTEWLLRWSG